MRLVINLIDYGLTFQACFYFFSVAHSTSAIDKPRSKMQEAAQREIEEAMKKVKEAQSLITAAADSGYCILGVTFLYQLFFFVTQE